MFIFLLVFKGGYGYLHLILNEKTWNFGSHEYSRLVVYNYQLKYVLQTLFWYQSLTVELFDQSVRCKQRYILSYDLRVR